MATQSRRQRGRDGALTSLNMAIGDLTLAKDKTSVTPAKAVFDSASVVVVMIRVSFLPAHVGRLLTGVYAGLGDQQKRLRRTRGNLCGRL